MRLRELIGTRRSRKSFHSLRPRAPAPARSGLGLRLAPASGSASGSPSFAPPRGPAQGPRTASFPTPPPGYPYLSWAVSPVVRGLSPPAPWKGQLVAGTEGTKPVAKAKPAHPGMLTLEGVGRRYGTRRSPVWALREVSLTVPAGQFVAVMGATGSGKSTLLHCAAGLDRPDAGRVWLAGSEIGRMGERRLTKLRRDRVGFVFQAYNLLSELSVAQNVLLPSRLGGPRVRREDVARVLESVGLAGLERRPVGELSGGQRQRVAVARALATGPAVVYADEPTGALDPTTGAQILGLLRDAVNRDGVTVVMVTHDPQAAAVSDRLVLLRAGQIVADGRTPDAGRIAEELRAASASSAATNLASTGPASASSTATRLAAAGPSA